MSKILIGSSNIARFYKAQSLSQFDPYIMKKCTKFEIFQVQMGHLGPEDKEIIISVIENFLCDAVVGISDRSLAAGIWEKIIKQFMCLVHDKAVNLPETKFALIPPILRPGNTWYSDDYEGICKFFNEGT